MNCLSGQIWVCLTVGVNSKVCVDAFFLLFSLKLYIQRCNHLDLNDVVPVWVGEKTVLRWRLWNAPKITQWKSESATKNRLEFCVFLFGHHQQKPRHKSCPALSCLQSILCWFYAHFASVCLPPSEFSKWRLLARTKRRNPCPRLWSCAWLNQRTYLHCTGR